MGEHVIKLPDVGEGVAEAELVEWMVEIGANVREDEVLAAVMTDKATVEIPSPVEGKIIWRGGTIGDVLSVGSPLIKLEVDGDGNVKPGTEPVVEAPKKAAPEKEKKPEQKSDVKPLPPKDQQSSEPKTNRAVPVSNVPRSEGEKPVASPAVRKRAAEAGIDLRRVPGTGPAGRGGVGVPAACSASGLRSHTSRWANGISIPAPANRALILWFISLRTERTQFTSRRIARTSKSSESAPNPLNTTEGAGLLSTIGCASAISRRMLSTWPVSLP